MTEDDMFNLGFFDDSFEELDPIYDSPSSPSSPEYSLEDSIGLEGSIDITPMLTPSMLPKNMVTPSAEVDDKTEMVSQVIKLYTRSKAILSCLPDFGTSKLSVKDVLRYYLGDKIDHNELRNLIESLLNDFIPSLTRDEKRTLTHLMARVESIKPQFFNWLKCKENESNLVFTMLVFRARNKERCRLNKSLLNLQKIGNIQ